MGKTKYRVNVYYLVLIRKVKRLWSCTSVYLQGKVSEEEI